MIPLAMIPKQALAIGVLSVALAASLYLNARQWSDARADEAADKAELELAVSEARADALARNAATARELAEEAERQRVALMQEQEEFVVAQRRREEEYRRRMAGITLACGPGEPFVDAFNDALNP